MGRGVGVQDSMDDCASGRQWISELVSEYHGLWIGAKNQNSLSTSGRQHAEDVAENQVPCSTANCKERKKQPVDDDRRSGNALKLCNGKKRGCEKDRSD